MNPNIFLAWVCVALGIVCIIAAGLILFHLITRD